MNITGLHQKRKAESQGTEGNRQTAREIILPSHAFAKD
jgi:hypothetical protein